MGKPADPDYWKKWRAAHPEYRARERERSKARERTTEQRRAERQRAEKRAARRRYKVEHEKRRRAAMSVEEYRAKIIAPQIERNKHNPRQAEAARQRRRNWRWSKRRERDLLIVEQAASVASRHVRPDGRTHYNDQRYEEALMVAALAIIEGKDPDTEVTKALQEQTDYLLHIAPLTDEAIAA